MRIELFRSQWPEQFFTTKRKANFSFVSWHSVRAINTAHNNTIYICKINKYLKKLALWDKITKITTRFIWESLRNSIWKWNQINITSPGYRKLLEIKKKRDLIPGSADPAHTNACIVSDPFTSGCSVVWNYAFIGMHALIPGPEANHFVQVIHNIELS